jgi:hypothetical protein
LQLGALRGVVGGIIVPTAEYYLKQAEIASRMALSEPDSQKARAMHILALDYFDKAYRAQVREAPPPHPTSSSNIIQLRRP